MADRELQHALLGRFQRRGRARRAEALDPRRARGDGARPRPRDAASLAVARYRFFGREVITFAVILLIALPGIVSGLALQAIITDASPLGVQPGLSTTIVGHATFCVVVVYNNVIARIRRTAARSTRRPPTPALTTGRRSAS